ncbi:MAG: LysR family transcriptional regulator [Pseudomonadota bacterium]
MIEQKSETIKPAARPAQPPPPLLFEMIRSFVALADELNLSRVVGALGSTRQTVRRHISTLEEAMGTPLFDIQDRQYRLTEAGHKALPDARDILARGATWLRGQSGRDGHLQHLTASVPPWEFHQQQQPMGQIWSDPCILGRETFRAWVMSSGQIEHPSFAHVRPYLIIYRKSVAGWICVEFGESSVYVNWFGRDFARSSIGRSLRQLPAGEEFSHLLDQAFEEIQATQTARLDHVVTNMPRADRPGAMVGYQRLILNGFFPDGSSAVMSLVFPAANLNITGVESEKYDDLEIPHIGDLVFDSTRYEGIASAEAS